MCDRGGCLHLSEIHKSHRDPRRPVTGLPVQRSTLGSSQQKTQKSHRIKLKPARKYRLKTARHDPELIESVTDDGLFQNPLPATTYRGTRFSEQGKRTRFRCHRRHLRSRPAPFPKRWFSGQFFHLTPRPENKQPGPHPISGAAKASKGLLPQSDTGFAAGLLGPLLRWTQIPSYGLSDFGLRLGQPTASAGTAGPDAREAN